MSIVPREFYLKDTATVAKSLLGKRIVREIGTTELSGTITETEAYKHKDDPASHAFRNVTERNKAMFGEVGRSYVYFTYGMHYCFNVVARHPKVEAGAVLIRAIKPEKGIKKMQVNRKKPDLKNLTNGPAKVTQALKITKEHYGVDLTKKSSIYITEGTCKVSKISATPRVGIRDGTENRWNFKLKVEI